MIWNDDDDDDDGDDDGDDECKRGTTRSNKTHQLRCPMGVLFYQVGCQRMWVSTPRCDILKSRSVKRRQTHLDSSDSCDNDTYDIP